jgi:two-component system, NarL family, response regulator DesR
MIRVLIAEDQAMVRGALAALLELESDIDVVAQATNGEQALELAQRLTPDVVLTDIEMPVLTGLELADQIRRAKLRTRVIILTTFAAGYLLKDNPSGMLANAIRNVHAGATAVDPELAREAWTERDPLTDRERRVLRLAGEGLSNAAIATSLSLAEGTVRNYLSDAILKLGAANRTDAARIARERGWL